MANKSKKQRQQQAKAENPIEDALAVPVETEEEDAVEVTAEVPVRPPVDPAECAPGVPEVLYSVPVFRGDEYIGRQRVMATTPEEAVEKVKANLAGDKKTK